MQIHGRAKLGPAGRLALCPAIEGGLSLRQAADRLNVTPATAHRGWYRGRLERSRAPALGCLRSAGSRASVGCDSTPLGTSPCGWCEPGTLILTVWKVLASARALPRAARSPEKKPSTATSGHARETPETCCTLMSRPRTL